MIMFLSIFRSWFHHRLHVWILFNSCLNYIWRTIYSDELFFIGDHRYFYIAWEKWNEDTIVGWTFIDKWTKGLMVLKSISWLSVVLVYPMLYMHDHIILYLDLCRPYLYFVWSLFELWNILFKLYSNFIWTLLAPLFEWGFE